LLFIEDLVSLGRFKMKGLKGHNRFISLKMKDFKTTQSLHRFKIKGSKACLLITVHCFTLAYGTRNYLLVIQSLDE
jgi:hypothetical protein